MEKNHLPSLIKTQQPTQQFKSSDARNATDQTKTIETRTFQVNQRPSSSKQYIKAKKAFDIRFLVGSTFEGLRSEFSRDCSCCKSDYTAISTKIYIYIFCIKDEAI